MAGVIIVGVRSFDDIIGRYFRSVDDRLPRPCAGVALILASELAIMRVVGVGRIASRIPDF